MTLESLLQFLNLPILGGVVYVAFVAGGAARELKLHGQRLEKLENQVWSNGRAITAAASGRQASRP